MTNIDYMPFIDSVLASFNVLRTRFNKDLRNMKYYHSEIIQKHRQM